MSLEKPQKSGVRVTAMKFGQPEYAAKVAIDEKSKRYETPANIILFRQSQVVDYLGTAFTAMHWVRCLFEF